MADYTETITDKKWIISIMNEADLHDDCIENDGELIQSGVWFDNDILIHYSMIDEEKEDLNDDETYHRHLICLDVEYDLYDTASALAGAGWTAEDHDLLMDNYDITDGLATAICEKFKEIAQEIVEPVEIAIGTCMELYAHADIDSPSEGEAFIEQIDRLSQGIVTFPPMLHGFEALVHADIDMGVASGICVEVLRAIVSNLIDVFDQVEDILREAIPTD